MLCLSYPIKKACLLKLSKAYLILNLSEALAFYSFASIVIKEAHDFLCPVCE